MINQSSFHLLTVAEAADQLAISASLLYQHVQSGRLAHYRLGAGKGAIRICPNDLATFLQSMRNEAQRKSSPAPKPKATALKHLLRQTSK